MRQASRRVGFFTLLVLFYSYTTGGPFGYEEIFSLAGPGVGLLLLTLIPFIWSVPVSLASVELGTRMPVQGGLYRWSRFAFGDFWGFQAGWWNWTGNFLLISTYGVLFMDYVRPYFPNTGPVVRWLGTVAFIWLLSGLNLLGIRVAGTVADILQVLVVSIVFVATCMAVFDMRGRPMAPIMKQFGQVGPMFGAGLALAMWNYVGYEQLWTVAEEVKEPARNYMRALACLTPAAIITTVVPPLLALLALQNWQEWKSGYFPTAIARLEGPYLGHLVALASVITVVLFCNSAILSTSRVPAAMAEDGYVPQQLSAIGNTTGAPTHALILCAIVCSLLAVENVVQLVGVYLWTRIPTTLLTLLAAYKVHDASSVSSLEFLNRRDIRFVYLVLIPSILSAAFLWKSDMLAKTYGPILLLTGPMAYWVSAHWRRSRSTKAAKA